MTFLLLELWVFLIVSCVFGFGMGWFWHRHFIELPRERAWKEKYDTAHSDRVVANEAQSRAETSLAELRAIHEKCGPKVTGLELELGARGERVESLLTEKKGLQEEVRAGNQRLIEFQSAKSE